MSGPAKQRHGTRLGVEGLEGRSLPAFGPAGNGLSIAVGHVNSGVTGNEYVIGSGPGTASTVSEYDTKGNLLVQVHPFPASFTGGVNVAVADVDGNGTKEIIVGAGAGGSPLVEIYDGTTGRKINSFFAYEASFRGGVYVAGGAVNGTAAEQVVTGSGVGGGPVVGIFNARGIRLAGFFSDEPGFRGGVTVAVADTTGSGLPDIVTGTGPGGGSAVRVFDTGGNQLVSFFAFGPASRDGVTVAAGNTDGLVGDDIYVTPSANSTGATPVIWLYNGSGKRIGADITPFPAGTVVANTVNMAVGDVNGDGIGDLVVVGGDTVTTQEPRVFVGKQNLQAGFNGP